MPRGNWSFLQHLLPSIRSRARSHIYRFRYETLPQLKARAQSKIYASIIKRQEEKRRKLSDKRIFPAITTTGRRILTNERSANMNSYYPDGSKRAKIAGYLQAANKLRQDYQARRVGAEDYPLSEGSPSFKVSRHGDDELILFPSYARNHGKSSNRQQNLAQGGASGDAEYWRREWEMYEDANAVVDVDLRGWIYTNLKGPMSRRNRLIMTVARQLSGIPAPDNSSGYGASTFADPESHSARHEEEMARREIEKIERRGRQESEAAQQGAYSMRPEDAFETTRESDGSGASTPRWSRDMDALSIRDAWNDPSEFSSAELEKANRNLTTRLRPFLTEPSVNAPLTIFYYNSETSQSRTTTTNEYGHFNYRAALSFVPTHVRVLAGENLSATEEVLVTESNGISLISDIDDTVKHSAITSGAREIFRNTFIRDLADLSIDGVRQWYTKMHDLGVKLHYVSNSPWQLYPLLAEYFGISKLPPGSLHLKQYTGMLQGIFEPAAERKKGSLDRIMHDFPDRRFILVGDSGEADLEVYTDVALAHPKRIIAVFIRDVTTPVGQNLRFFNTSSQTSRKPWLGDSSTGCNIDPVAEHSEGQSQEKPALPPRRKLEEPPEEEDLIDLSDDVPLQPPNRSSTDPIKSAADRPQFPLRVAQSSVGSGSVSRKQPPPRPPKPRQFSNRPDLTSQVSSYTDAIKGKVTSVYNSIPTKSIARVSTSRSSSPVPSPHFGQGSLAFADDGNLTNDCPAPPLPRRTGSTGYPGESARQYSDSSSPASKKEEFWKRRWLRARELLEDRGIVLKAWRTGSDVMDQAVQLVEDAKRAR